VVQGESQRRDALASPVTYSPTLIHLFERRGAQPLGANPGDHPPRVAVSMYAVVGLALVCGSSRAREQWLSTSRARPRRLVTVSEKERKEEMHARCVTAFLSRR